MNGLIWTTGLSALDRLLFLGTSVVVDEVCSAVSEPSYSLSCISSSAISSLGSCSSFSLSSTSSWLGFLPRGGNRLLAGLGLILFKLTVGLDLGVVATAPPDLLSGLLRRDGDLLGVV